MSLTDSIPVVREDKPETLADRQEGTAVQTISIQRIRPDPNQPRQIIPEELRDKVPGSDPVDIMHKWTELAENDATCMQRLQGIEELAQTLHEQGLIHAITVREKTPTDDVADDVEYLIVTGERRFWAHVYLATQGKPVRWGDTNRNPEHVRTEVVPQDINVSAYQLIENIHKSSLNALEKARGYVALRRERAAQLLSGSTNEDVDPSDIPWEKVENIVPWTVVDEMVGKSPRYRRHVLQVLDLHEQTQQTIAELNLSERAVRPLAAVRDDIDLQEQVTEALRKKSKLGDPITGSAVEQLVTHYQNPHKSRSTSDDSSGTETVFDPDKPVRSILNLVGQLRDLSKTQRKQVTKNMDEEIVEQIEQLRDELGKLLELVEQ